MVAAADLPVVVTPRTPLSGSFQESKREIFSTLHVRWFRSKTLPFLSDED
jgi:hypothetical protein